MTRNGFIGLPLLCMLIPLLGLAQFPIVVVNNPSGSFDQRIRNCPALGVSGCASFNEFGVGKKLVADYIDNGWFHVDLPYPTNTSTKTQGFTYSGWGNVLTDHYSAYLTVNVGTSGLNIRTGPGTSYGQVTLNGLPLKVWNGQRYAITGQSGGWYQIDLPKGCVDLCFNSTGWVSGSFVSVTPASNNQTLTVSANPACVDNIGGSSTININSNLTWCAIPNSSWITITDPPFSSLNNASSDFGNGSLTISYGSYFGTTPRIGFLTLQPPPPLQNTIVQVVQSGTLGNPYITSHPSNASANTGQSVSFSVTAGGVPNVSYQWQKNGSNIPGATSSTYSIANVSNSDAGNYRCVVFNACNTQLSNAANLSVNAPCSAPSIVQQPSTQSTCSGGQATFYVNASGTLPLNYQWRKNGSNIPGATFSFYTINSVSSGDVGTYACFISNACGSVLSAGASLTIAPCLPPVANFTASPRVINAGADVQFQDQSTNNPYQFDWVFARVQPSNPPLTFTASGPNPVVTFNRTGVYDVTLTATNQHGSDIEPKPAYIQVKYGSGVNRKEEYAVKNDHSSACCRDPINMASGAYFYNHTDFSIPDIGFDLVWSRYYNSRLASVYGYKTDMAYGWSHSFDISVTNEADSMWTVHYGDGHKNYFIPFGGDTTIPLYPETTEKLKQNPDGSYTLTFKNGIRYEFNNNGKLAEVIDRNGNQLTLQYTGNQLTGITGEGGRGLSIAYDAQNRITSVEDPLQRKVQYAYDSQDNLLSVRYPAGDSTRYIYDGQHQMRNIIKPSGDTLITNYFDAQHRVYQHREALGETYTINWVTPSPGRSIFTDPNGSITVFEHDEGYKLTKMIDQEGDSVLYVYDDRANLTRITNANGKNLDYAYDADNNLTQIKDALNHITQLAYYADHTIKLVQNALNHTTQFFYNATGNLTKITDANGIDWLAAYDGHGQVTNLTDGNNRSYSFQYNAFGDLTRINSPVSFVEFEYDAAGRLEKVTDANQQETVYSFNDNDFLLSITNAKGDHLDYTYDINNRLIQTANWRGHTSTIRYDHKDRIVALVNALNDSTQFQYDALDNLVQVTDANQNAFDYEYDGKGRLTKATNDLGSTEYFYDAVGNVTSVKNALGKSTQYQYDDLNRLIEITDPLSHKTTFTYDAISQLTQVTNALNNSTHFAYDPLGRLLQSTNPENGVTQYQYDNNGNLTQVTKPKGNHLFYTYDAGNRLVTKQDDVNNTYQYRYDAIGNIDTIIDPDGILLTYSYDAIYNLTQINYSSGQFYQYAYDANSNITQATNTEGATMLEYDVLDRITKVTDVFSREVNYAYDKVGNLEQLTYPGNKTVQYAYNGVNLLEQVTDWQGKQYQYTYDALGRLEQLAYPNNTLNTFQYDDANRVTNITSKTMANDIIYSSQYTYDALGMRTGEVRTPEVPHQLRESTFNYSYRLNDEILTANTETFTHDGKGNIWQRINNTDTSTFLFAGDDLLASLQLDTQTFQYGYDAFRNRITKNQNGAQLNRTMDINGSLSQVLQERDGAGSLLSENVFGLGLLSRLENNEQLYYHFDATGNTMAITNDTGGVVKSYLYEPFGVMIGQLGSVEQPFRFMGQFGVEAENEEFYFVRARYYDGGLGRFVSVDPVEDNQQSIYLGINDNPINYIDADGQEPRLGQLGNVSEILYEVDKVYPYFNELGFTASLRGLGEYFDKNKQITYNAETGNFDDKPGSQNVRRYIYMKKMGWIDLQHFFLGAYSARKPNIITTIYYSYLTEGIQYYSKHKIVPISPRTSSAFSYEDIPSNFAGGLFISMYGNSIKRGKVSMHDALEKFFISMEATDPRDAPNFEFIPYFSDDLNIKNYGARGLTGDLLREAHSEVYQKRSSQLKCQIELARKILTY